MSEARRGSSTTSRIRWVRGAAITTLVAGAMVLAACGDDSSSTSATSASSGTTASGDSAKAACVAAAEKGVAAARADLPLQKPTSPLDLAKLKGKHVWLINGLHTPLLDDIAKGFTAAAKAAGAVPTIYDGQGQVAKWNQGIDQAVAQGADGIVTIAIDPKLVSQSLAAAAAKDIPVVDGYGSSPGTKPLPGVSGATYLDMKASGPMIADWVLADSGCDADTLALTGANIQNNTDLMAAYQARVKELCPDCKVKVLDFDPNTLATDLGQKVQAGLRSDPKVNYVFPAFDGAVTYAGPAVAAAGGSVKVISHDGADANLDLVRKGDQAVDVAFPGGQWMGWLTFDQLARAMLGMPPAKAVVPVRLLDKTNIGQSNAGLFPAYDDFQDAWVKSWRGEG